MPFRRAAVVPLLLWPAAAFSHDGHSGDAAGFLAGLAHPVGGADHLLAMVAVGMLGATLGGRSVWTLPAAFLFSMALGGMAGFSGFGLPEFEPVILASVISLGAALALALRVPGALFVAAVSLFGLAHGTAHGVEAPAGGGVHYGLGFLVASAALHAAGVLAARGLIGVGAHLGTRLFGAASACAGIALAVLP